MLTAYHAPVTWADLEERRRTSDPQPYPRDNHALKWLRWALAENPVGFPLREEIDLTLAEVQLPPVLRQGPIPEAYSFALAGGTRQPWSWQLMLANRLSDAPVDEKVRGTEAHLQQQAKTAELRDLACQDGIGGLSLLCMPGERDGARIGVWKQLHKLRAANRVTDETMAAVYCGSEDAPAPAWWFAVRCASKPGWRFLIKPTEKHGSQYRILKDGVLSAPPPPKGAPEKYAEQIRKASGFKIPRGVCAPAADASSSALAGAAASSSAPAGGAGAAAYAPPPPPQPVPAAPPQPVPAQPPVPAAPPQPVPAADASTPYLQAGGLAAQFNAQAPQPLNPKAPPPPNALVPPPPGVFTTVLPSPPPPVEGAGPSNSAPAGAVAPAGPPVPAAPPQPVPAQPPVPAAPPQPVPAADASTPASPWERYDSLQAGGLAAQVNAQAPQPLKHQIIPNALVPPPPVDGADPSNSAPAGDTALAPAEQATPSGPSPPVATQPNPLSEPEVPQRAIIQSVGTGTGAASPLAGGVPLPADPRSAATAARMQLLLNAAADSIAAGAAGTPSAAADRAAGDGTDAGGAAAGATGANSALAGAAAGGARPGGNNPPKWWYDGWNEWGQGKVWWQKPATGGPWRVI